MKPAADAIKALQKLKQACLDSDQTVDAKAVDKLIDQVVQLAIGYTSIGDLAANEVFVCSECHTVFEPWHDADETECDRCEKCGGADEMLLDAAYYYEHRG